jgi:hypothetical protein
MHVQRQAVLKVLWLDLTGETTDPVDELQRIRQTAESGTAVWRRGLKRRSRWYPTGQLCDGRLPKLGSNKSTHPPGWHRYTGKCTEVASFSLWLSLTDCCCRPECDGHTNATATHRLRPPSTDCGCRP